MVVLGYLMIDIERILIPYLNKEKTLEGLINDGYRIEERKNIMYLALGWAGGIVCVLFYAYDYIIFSYISFFFAAAGFVIDHKESNK